MMIVFCLGADSAMWAAILLGVVSLRLSWRLEMEAGNSCLLCDGFWCYAEPGVFGHPDALVVLFPDFVSLEPVSVAFG